MTVAVQQTATRSARRVPLIIRISPSFPRTFRGRVQARADREVERAPAAAAGLLFGRVNDREVEVDSFRLFAVSCPDETGIPDTELWGRGFDECLTASKEHRELASLDLIGWCCMRSDGESGLLDREIEFHNRHFRRISDIALILSSEKQVDRLNVYTRWANIAMSAERHRYGMVEFRDEIATAESVTATMQPRVNEYYQRRVYQVPDSMHGAQRAGTAIAFPPQGSRVASTEPISRRDQAVCDEQRISWESADAPRLPGSRHALESASVGESPPAPLGSLGRPWAAKSPWIEAKAKSRMAAAVAFLLIGALTCTWMYLRRAPGSIHREAPASGTETSMGLGMRLQREGDSLLVSWDRRNPAIRSANSAALEITDGLQRREIHLDSREIANGSVLYTPASSDVTLRLKISRQHGSIRSENIRVLDGSKMPLRVDGPGNLRSRVEAKGITETRAMRPAGSKPASAQLPRAVPQSIAPDLRRERGSPTSPNPGPRKIAAAVPQSGTRKSELSAPSSTKVPSPQDPGAEKRPRLVQNQVSPKLPATVSARKPAGVIDRALTGASPAKDRSKAASVEPGIVAGSYAARKTTTDRRALAAYVPPRPIKQVMPERIFGQSVIDKPVHIGVILRIDETGRVIEEHLAKGSDENESLARSALSTARQWIFQPATIDGKKVPSDHTVQFRFLPESR